MGNYEMYQNRSLHHKDDQVVTIGEWAIWLAIVALVPIYGIIHVCITAFGQDKKESMRNFARVYLIYVSILFIIFFIMIMPIISAAMEAVRQVL